MLNIRTISYNKVIKESLLGDDKGMLFRSDKRSMRYKNHVSGKMEMLNEIK